MDVQQLLCEITLHSIQRKPQVSSWCAHWPRRHPAACQMRGVLFVELQSFAAVCTQLVLVGARCEGQRRSSKLALKAGAPRMSNTSPREALSARSSSSRRPSGEAANRNSLSSRSQQLNSPPARKTGCSRRPSRSPKRYRALRRASLYFCAQLVFLRLKRPGIQSGAC